jgi:hypothetical protein
MGEWLTAVRDSIKPSTHTNYVDYLDAYVLPSIGKRELQSIANAQRALSASFGSTAPEAGHEYRDVRVLADQASGWR